MMYSVVAILPDVDAVEITISTVAARVEDWLQAFTLMLASVEEGTV
jgi:hypothetical protein